MTTTKQQRRFNGLQNAVAAHRRNSNKATTASTAPAAESQQQETLTVKLEVSPVNAPAEPSVPVTPAAPETPTALAAPESFTAEQEMAMIATGLKTLLGLEGDINLTPEGLMKIGLRTVRQTLVAILANEETVRFIRAKKEGVIEMGMAWIAEATAPAAPAEPEAPAAPAEPAPPPAAEVRQEPRVLAVGSLARWLPSGQMANRVHLHADDKEVGVVGEHADYRWYKVDGELVWDYK